MKELKQPSCGHDSLPLGELHPLKVCVALDSDPMDLDRPPK
ncbi:hypothetical protein Tco_0663739, partial [Tanacetum coccineum]